MLNWNGRSENAMSKFVVHAEYKNGSTRDYIVYEDVWYDYLHKALEDDDTVTYYFVETIK